MTGLPAHFPLKDLQAQLATNFLASFRYFLMKLDASDAEPPSHGAIGSPERISKSRRESTDKEAVLDWCMVMVMVMVMVII